MLTPIKKPLKRGAQADVHPRLGLIFIDSSVHEDEWPRIIAEALNEITGEGSAYVFRPRAARLTVLEGGLGASG